MKHIGIATLAAGLFLATSALAHDEHRGGGGAPQPQASHGGGAPHGDGHPSFSRPAPFEHRGAPAVFERDHRGGPAPFEHRVERRNVDVHVSVSAGVHAVRPGYAHDARGFGVRPDNWNNRPRNFDRGGYQRNFRAEHRFSYGAYRRPEGWYYRQWRYGEFLPTLFWARDYWINNWWMFDLPIPPYGYEWVRYGDDALLINVYTGEILEVEYGVFY